MENEDFQRDYKRLKQEVAAIQRPEVVGIYGSWANAFSAPMFLPGLRAFWPCAPHAANDSFAGALLDTCGGGFGWFLDYNGNPTYNFDGLIPYIALDGTGDYFSRPNADDAGVTVTGTESYIASSKRGLTLGGWFWFNTLTASDGIMSKWGVTGTSGSYMIYIQSGLLVQFIVENSAGTFKQVNGVGPGTGGWVYLVARFTPSTEIALFMGQTATGLTKYTNTTSIIASLRDAAIDFQLGNFSAGGSPMDGRASCCWLSAMALSDDIITSLFQTQRQLFGQ